MQPVSPPAGRLTGTQRDGTAGAAAAAAARRTVRACKEEEGRELRRRNIVKLETAATLSAADAAMPADADFEETLGAGGGGLRPSVRPSACKLRGRGTEGSGEADGRTEAESRLGSFQLG